MQNQKKCYQNVWILSGTADGPILANKLIDMNHTVFISVVSYKASEVYSSNNKLHIITGKINNEKEIQEFIIKNKIKYIIDATHPFAINISRTLENLRLKIEIPIFTFKRVSQIKSNGEIISTFKDIKYEEIKDKNILLAIGSRRLNEIAQFYLDLGANVFARIIATPESISKGFSSCIRNSHLAILNPSKIKGIYLESYLCKYWDINYILCRDSGGYSQKIWDEICLQTNIKLFLLQRPKVKNSEFLFSTYDDLIKKILNFY